MRQDVVLEARLRLALVAEAGEDLRARLGQQAARVGEVARQLVALHLREEVDEALGGEQADLVEGEQAHRRGAAALRRVLRTADARVNSAQQSILCISSSLFVHAGTMFEEKTNKQTNKRTNKQTNKQTSERTNKQTKYKQTNKQTFDYSSHKSEKNKIKNKMRIKTPSLQYSPVMFMADVCTLNQCSAWFLK